MPTQILDHDPKPSPHSLTPTTGDGKLDLVLGGSQNRSWAIALHNGHGDMADFPFTVTNVFAAPDTSTGYGRATVVDIDGDDDLDVSGL